RPNPTDYHTDYHTTDCWPYLQGRKQDRTMPLKVSLRRNPLRPVLPMLSLESKRKAPPLQIRFRAKGLFATLLAVVAVAALGTFEGQAQGTPAGAGTLPLGGNAN